MTQPRPTREGNLKKYRNIFLGWSTRFFRLERSYFHYFEARHAPEPLGSITRGDILDVKESTQFEGKNFVFELHTKSGAVWYLQATSQDEMFSWMQDLVPGKLFPSSGTDQETSSGFLVVSESSPQPTCHPSQGATGLSPSWPGSQSGQYLGHNTSPMHQPPFDPRMFATGGPLYDPRVHSAQVPYTPPPPYSEESPSAQPLPSKTGLS